MCLIINGFAIRMLHEKKSDFKNWTWPKILVVSLQSNIKIFFGIINFPKKIKIPFQKIKEPPLLQQPLFQPVVSVELFISDLIE